MYLPVAAALRRADPAMEETARSLGAGRVATFVRVTLPMVRTAVLGGCLLVVLAVLAEYGAFEILRYQTFTTEIFTEFQFDAQAAGALSVPLVLLGLLVLALDALVPRRFSARTAPGRELRLRTPRWRGVPIMAALLGLVGLGVGVPIGTLVYWMVQSQHTTLPATATLATATWTTLSYSAWGAAVAVLLALPGRPHELPAHERPAPRDRAGDLRHPGRARCRRGTQPRLLGHPLRLRPLPDERAAW